MHVYTEWLTGNAVWSMQVSSLSQSIFFPANISVEWIIWWSNRSWGCPIIQQDQYICNDRQKPSPSASHQSCESSHMKETNHAFLLLALLPIQKFIHKDQKTCSILENCMIHECLDFILKPLKKAAEVSMMMLDPLGFQCYVYTTYIINVTLALLGIAEKILHITMATYRKFGNPFQHEPWTVLTTLVNLHAIEDTVSPWQLAAYIKVANICWLNGVHCPFWCDWPLSEPLTFFTLEPLHHWHKMFWDHDAKWCICAIGAAKIDFCFSILHLHTGFHQFNEGILKLKQVTGREHCDIQHYLIPVIADAISKDFLIAIWSLMDFWYLTQAPEISESICTEINAVLKEFHDHKHIIISSGAQTGKGNAITNNWYIPKLKLMQSVTSNIHENGAAIQWSADATEWHHVTEIKKPLHAGNNQEYKSQICCFLDQININGSTLPLPSVRPILTSAFLLMIHAWKRLWQNSSWHIWKSWGTRRPFYHQYDSSTLNTHSANHPHHKNYPAKCGLLEWMTYGQITVDIGP